MQRTTLPLIWSLLLIAVFGLFLQCVAFHLSHDVSWLLHCGRRILAGGDYGGAIVELNPPMSVYLYLLPVWVTQVFGFDSHFMVRLFTSIIGVGSLCLSATVLRYSTVKVRVLLLLAVSYFFLIAGEFGQREHILLMLQMPYVLSLAFLSPPSPLSVSQRILIAVAAGLSICIKPHFLVLWCALAIYQCQKRKSIFSIENISIGIVIALYLLVTMIASPGYWREIFVMTLGLFAPSYQQPLLNILYKPIVFFCLLSGFAYWGSREKYSAESTVVFLAMCSSVLAYVLGGTSWFYHAYPAMIYGALLLVICFSEGNLPQPRGFAACIVVTAILLLALIVTPSFRYRSVTPWKQELIRFINQNASNKPIYVISPFLGHTYSMLDYTSAYTLNRYAAQWPLLSVLKRPGTPEHPYIDVLRAHVVTDLKKELPKYVFIDNYVDKFFPETPVSIYIKVLSQNAEFAHLWKRYKKVNKIGELTVYKINSQ